MTLLNSKGGYDEEYGSTDAGQGKDDILAGKPISKLCIGMIAHTKSFYLPLSPGTQWEEGRG